MNNSAEEGFEDERRRCSWAKFQMPTLLCCRSTLIPSTVIVSKVLVSDSNVNHTGLIVIKSIDSSFDSGKPFGLARDKPFRCNVLPEIEICCMLTGWPRLSESNRDI